MIGDFCLDFAFSLLLNFEGITAVRNIAIQQIECSIVT